MSRHACPARWPVLLVLVGSVACGDDPVGPARPLPTTALTLCVYGDWVAFQNEGAPWRLLSREPDGTHAFAATARLGIAIARVGAVSPYLRVTYLTADQARELYPCSTPPILQRGTVRGTVLGLSPPYDYAGGFL